MKKIILALALALASYGAYAHDSRVRWTNATEFTDGTLIANAVGDDAVASTQVEYGSCTGAAGSEVFGTAAGAMVAPWAGTEALFTGLPNGKFCFRARHTTVAGVSSAWSQVVAYTFTGKKTRAPSQITITIIAPLP